MCCSAAVHYEAFKYEPLSSLQEVKRGPGTLIRRNSVTPLTSPESNIKKPRIDDLDEAPIQELPPSVASLALCSPSHIPLTLAGQVITFQI